MPREFPRARRVAEQIQRELAELIQLELMDPRLGMVSISGVEVSRDLAYATVYFTVLGKEGQNKDTGKVLNHAAGFLRRRLGQQMITRTVPELRFVHDRSLEKGARLSALIDKAVGGDTCSSVGDKDDD